MKESDIRPANIHNEYLRLSALDTQSYFSGSIREVIPCVACGQAKVNWTFDKNGFGYVVCTECHSLFQSPRPTRDEFKHFYEDSASSRYWAQYFFPAVVEKRRELIFKPRAAAISELCLKKNIRADGTVVDVGAGHGIFLEEWRRLHPMAHLRAVEPSREMAQVCRSKSIEVLETIAEEARAFDDCADLLVCFEVIEHVYQPVEFLKALWKLVKPGGYAIVSGLGGDGYDIQVLWENSKSVSPPHHINFLSIEGFEKAFRSAGFSNPEILTPGKLDVDIVFNSTREKPEILEGKNFEKVLFRRGPKAMQLFQEFLASHQMSSHTWVVAQRPK